MTSVIVRPLAKLDVAKAVDWYDSQQSGLGGDFIDAFQDVLVKLSEHPKSYQSIYKDTRRVVMRRFPYSVFYIIEQSVVHVLGVRYSGTNPGSWPGVEYLDS